MTTRHFYILFLLVFAVGCAKKTPTTTPQGDGPAVVPPPEVRNPLACLGKYETTEPEIAKQTLTFQEDGQCGFAHEAFPGTPYVCTYEVKDPKNAKVTLLVSGTTEGWNFESQFADDCATVEPTGFGLKFRRKP